jgi:hypothetical protein
VPVVANEKPGEDGYSITGVMIDVPVTESTAVTSKAGVCVKGCIASCSTAA